MIIAVNTDANSLAIVTNVYFSHNTQIQLENYSRKTGLKIKCITGIELFNWINGDNNIDISQTLFSLLAKSKDVTVSSGLNINQISSDIQAAFSYEQLIGDNRKKLSEAILSKILKGIEMIIIEGNAGTGKSFFQILYSIN